MSPSAETRFSTVSRVLIALAVSAFTVILFVYFKESHSIQTLFLTTVLFGLVSLTAGVFWKRGAFLYPAGLLILAAYSFSDLFQIF